MKTKSDMEIMLEMARNDQDISMSPNFVRCDTVKAGGHVVMGTDRETIMKLMAGGYTCALYVIKNDQFFPKKKEESVWDNSVPASEVRDLLISIINAKGNERQVFESIHEFKKKYPAV